MRAFKRGEFVSDIKQHLPRHILGYNQEQLAYVWHIGLPQFKYLSKYFLELTRIRQQSLDGRRPRPISIIMHLPFPNQYVIYLIFWSQNLITFLGYPHLSWIPSGWNLWPSLAARSRSRAVPETCLSDGRGDLQNNFREAKPCRCSKLLVNGDVSTSLPFSGQIFYCVSP